MYDFNTTSAILDVHGDLNLRVRDSK